MHALLLWESEPACTCTPLPSSSVAAAVALGSVLIASRCRELPDSGLARNFYGVTFANENVNCTWFSFIFVVGVFGVWFCCGFVFGCRMV